MERLVWGMYSRDRAKIIIMIASRPPNLNQENARIVYTSRELGEDKEATEAKVYGTPGPLPVRKQFVQCAEREPVDGLRGVPRASRLGERVQDALKPDPSRKAQVVFFHVVLERRKSTEVLDRCRVRADVVGQGVDGAADGKIDR